MESEYQVARWSKEKALSQTSRVTLDECQFGALNWTMGSLALSTIQVLLLDGDSTSIQVDAEEGSQVLHRPYILGNTWPGMGFLTAI